MIGKTCKQIELKRASFLYIDPDNGPAVVYQSYCTSISQQATLIVRDTHQIS